MDGYGDLLLALLSISFSPCTYQFITLPSRSVKLCLGSGRKRSRSCGKSPLSAAMQPRWKQRSSLCLSNLLVLNVQASVSPFKIVNKGTRRSILKKLLMSLPPNEKARNPMVLSHLQRRPKRRPNERLLNFDLSTFGVFFELRANLHSSDYMPGRLLLTVWMLLEPIKTQTWSLAVDRLYAKSSISSAWHIAGGVVLTAL